MTHELTIQGVWLQGGDAGTSIWCLTCKKELAYADEGFSVDEIVAMHNEHLEATSA